MTKVRIGMLIQGEIKRLKELGHSKNKVSKILGINRETVRKYWHDPPDELPQDIPLWVKDLDWGYINKEIERKTPKKILFEELSENFKLPSYQSFCQYIRNHPASDGKENIVIKIQRTPGDSVEVDYSGDSVEILNPATGEIYRVELFVGTLSYSGYFYAEFTLTQKLEDFIYSHTNMFRFFGGVTKYIIPDNCKTAVTKPDKYDPLINRTYHDMCVHYGIAVDPADGYCPRHKPNVEKSVDIIQQDFFPRIRNKTYTSLIELNRDLKEWLIKKNQVLMKDRGNSRLYFYNKEKDQLRTLPENNYEIFYFKKAKVHPDCHFQHQRNFYSAPWNFVGKEIEVKYNNRMIHAYSNVEGIATHKALQGHGHYSTNDLHYPEEKIVEVNYHLSSSRAKAKKIGPNMELLVEKLIKMDQFPLKSLRKVQGVLEVSKGYSKSQIEYGAEMCLEFNRLTRSALKKFSNNYREKKETTTLEAPKRQLELICLQGGLDNANR